jgi:glycosyltransferase involved in cell wall biosynthesis
MQTTDPSQWKKSNVAKLSVIIPAWNELYLKATVDGILKSATGDIEVIVMLDGYWPHELPADDPRLILVHRKRGGMRAAINGAVAIAKGEFILKADAHCLFAPGFDETLKADCDKDWIVIPRRYSLEADTWEIRRSRGFVDYEYLSWPYRASGRRQHGASHGICGMVWDQRIIDRCNVQIDENMTFQGSCWFTPREYFLSHLGPLKEEGYGTFVAEAQELGMRAWLGGGKIMVNKKTWYAHLWKGEPYRQEYEKVFGKSYTRLGFSERKAGNLYAVDYWINNRWTERKHDLEWLINRFAPVPSWPKDKTQWIPSNI